MKPLIAGIAVFLLLSISARAQVLEFTFSNQSQDAAVTPTTVDLNASATAITRTNIGLGDGVNFSTPTNFLGGGDGQLPTGSTPDTAKYFSFSLTPNAGYLLNLTSFNFAAGLQDGGMVDVRYSTDGFATYTDLGSSVTSMEPNSPSSISLSSSLSNVSSTTDFRIYFYQASNGYETAGLDTITLNGSIVSTIPEPSVSALIVCGILVLGYIARRRVSLTT